MEQGISVALIISTISLICTMINTLVNSKKVQNEQADVEKSRQMDIEKNFVKINIKLDDFHDSVKKIAEESAKKDDQLKELMNQVIVINERIKNLYKENDDKEERLKQLESKMR